MELIYIFGVICIAYCSTNMDNLLCLIVFFSNKSIKTRYVFTGWFLGSLIVISISLLIAHAGTHILSEKYIGILGLFPIVIGAKGVYSLYIGKQNNLFNSPPHQTEISYSKSHVFTGAFITVINGGDNISAYTPLFLLASNIHGILAEFLAFLFMTTAFSIIGYYLVRKNKYLGQTICQYGTFMMPFILIFIGSTILYQSFIK